MKAKLARIEKRKTVLIQELTRKNSRLENDKSAFIQCVICRDRLKDTLLKPCNHICVCETCAGQIEECPLDRMKITSYTKVFLS